jgi:hypothetical protein
LLFVFKFKDFGKNYHIYEKWKEKNARKIRKNEKSFV